MLLAIIPLLAWGIGAVVVGVGGTIVARCCRGASSSNSSVAHQGGTSSFARCLLAGYHEAGKSEFVCGLSDYLQFRERRTHAIPGTIKPKPECFRDVENDWSVECVDGPGNIDGGQQDRYTDFLQDANRFCGLRPDVVVFVVDLTTITDVSKKRMIKSEMEILNSCAAACRGADCSRKIHMAVVGSHMDGVDQGELDLQQDFYGWMNAIISSDYFDPWYICGDLYSDCSVANQFCDHLRGGL